MSWQSYTEAVVRVMSSTGAIEVRSAPITESPDRFPDPTGRAIHIITAHNPQGIDQSDAANATAHRRLLATLHERGLAHWDAAWRRPGVGPRGAGRGRSGPQRGGSPRARAGVRPGSGVRVDTPDLVRGRVRREPPEYGRVDVLAWLGRPGRSVQWIAWEDRDRSTARPMPRRRIR